MVLRTGYEQATNGYALLTSTIYSISLNMRRIIMQLQALAIIIFYLFYINTRIMQ